MNQNSQPLQSLKPLLLKPRTLDPDHGIELESRCGGTALGGCPVPLLAEDLSATSGSDVESTGVLEGFL